MADEPSDACSRTDGDVVRAGRNNKRKSSQACSCPNKRESYVIKVFALVVFMFIYPFIKYDDGEESDEEDSEEEEDDYKSHAKFPEITVDEFKAVMAWAERELGPENANLKKVLGMFDSYQDMTKQ